MPGSHATAYARGRALERIEQLARRGLAAVTFLMEAGRELEQAVPFNAHALPNPTWLTLDPASLLVTSMIEGGEGGRSCEMSPQEWATFEYASETLGNRISDVVRHPRGIQTGSELIHAHPHRAREYRELLADIGAAHEVLVALQTSDGAHWGAFYLNREPGRPDFSSEEVEFLRVVAPHLADGVRRGLLVGEAWEPEGLGAPAIAVLGPGLSLEASTPGAEPWLAALPGSIAEAIPPAVVSVAQSVLRDPAGHDRSTTARVYSDTRGWATLHGQALTGPDGLRAAVTIQAAGPDQITPLLMAAYGLTDREEQITRHVLQGGSTTEIAKALTISPYTVQDHLKSVFEKTSVSSRRELAGRVFARHYGPRVEDNSTRIERDQPVRGGPWPDRPSANPDAAADTTGGGGDGNDPR